MAETDERNDPIGEAGVSQKTSEVLPRPGHLAGETYRIETPLGKAYVTVNRSGEGEPFEVFVNLGKAGSDLRRGLPRLLVRVSTRPQPAQRAG